LRKINRLLDERPQGGATALVARRGDLDDADHTAEWVADGNAVATRGQHLSLRPENLPNLRRWASDDGTARPFGPVFQRNDVRHDSAGVLLDQRRKAFRQQTAVHRVTDRHCPRLVEIVEEVGIDASPVVNRHGFFSSGRPWLRG
jgi:hypothetical protein